MNAKVGPFRTDQQFVSPATSNITAFQSRRKVPITMQSMIGRIWPAGVALGLALLLVWLVPETPLRRMSNLDLENAPVSANFLMFSESRDGRCRVLDRRASTTRRDDAHERGRYWKCSRIASVKASPLLDSWLAQSSRIGKGTVLFVPIYAVRDWSFPFFYQFVRAREQNGWLPKVEWTQLFLDRLYAGLHLKVSLPFDLREKDGGSGLLRSIITLDGDGMVAVDTQLEEQTSLRGSKSNAIANPTPEHSNPELLWLMAQRGARLTLLMSDQAPNPVSYLPLPISLPNLFEAREGRPLVRIDHTEASASSWVRLRDRVDSSADLDASRSEELRTGFADYAVVLKEAMRTDAAFHETLPLLQELFPERQAAGLRLGLELGEL